MRLLLIRHPQPLIEPGICYGSSDLAVSAGELAQAGGALEVTLTASLDATQANALTDPIPYAPVRAPARGMALYTSPLQRCAQLAQHLATTMDLAPAISDARLAELHFGRWELQRWDDIPRDEIDAWAADMVNYQPGGGESVLQMAQRVAAFYQHWRAQQQDAIVVCHAGTIRLLQACQRGLAPAAMALEAAQQPHHIAYGSTLLLQT